MDCTTQIARTFDTRFAEFTPAEDIVPQIFLKNLGFDVCRADRKVHANPDFIVQHSKSSAVFAVEVKVCTTPIFYQVKSDQIRERHGVHIQPLDLLYFTARHVEHYMSYTARTGVPVHVLYIATWQPGLVYFDALPEMPLYATANIHTDSIRGTQTQKLYADAAQTRTLAEGLSVLSRDTGCPDLSHIASGILIRAVETIDCIKQVTYPAGLDGADVIAERLAADQASAWGQSWRAIQANS